MSGLHAIECARLLDWLLVHDEVREADFAHQDARLNADGGDRIERVAARMHDLKKSGHNVRSRREGRRAVYSLQDAFVPQPKALADDGFVRRETCRRCMGIVVTPCAGAGSYTVAVPPYQADTGCLSTREQEVPRVAA